MNTQHRYQSSIVWMCTLNYKFYINSLFSRTLYSSCIKRKQQTEYWNSQNKATTSAKISWCSLIFVPSQVYISASFSKNRNSGLHRWSYTEVKEKTFVLFNCSLLVRPIEHAIDQKLSLTRAELSYCNRVRSAVFSKHRPIAEYSYRVAGSLSSSLHLSCNYLVTCWALTSCAKGQWFSCEQTVDSVPEHITNPGNYENLS